MSLQKNNIRTTAKVRKRIFLGRFLKQYHLKRAKMSKRLLEKVGIITFMKP